MPIIHDPMRLPARTGTIYPAPFNEGYDKRHKRALTQKLGLSQFGTNITTLEPGGKSAERHWHKNEDEFVYILQGNPTLVDMHGKTELSPGMALGFPAGDKNGHQIINESDEDAIILEVGTRASEEEADYPDIDLKVKASGGKFVFTHNDGTPYK